METIELGDFVADVVSGWEGTAVARHEYLNGCVRWEISGTDKDGKPEGFVFDQQQIRVLEKGHFKEPNSQPKGLVHDKRPRTGGPRSNAPISRSQP